MKYLKRYNEELRPLTYRKAGNELKKIGHTKRGDELINWADISQKKITDRKTKERIEEAKNLGVYRMKLLKSQSSSPVVLVEGNFFINFYLDVDVLKEDYRDWKEDGQVLYLLFGFGVIPADEETRYKLLTCIGGEDELHLGTYQPNSMYLNISPSYTTDIEEPILNPTGELTFDADGHGHGEVLYFSDRRSAIQFKKALIDIFEGEIVYGETDEIPGGMKEIIMDELCSERDRNLEEFESIIKSLRKININKIYKD